MNSNKHDWRIPSDVVSPDAQRVFQLLQISRDNLEKLSLIIDIQMRILANQPVTREEIDEAKGYVLEAAKLCQIEVKDQRSLSELAAGVGYMATGTHFPKD